VRRRAFIALLGGAAVWPLAARAQEGERVRRIGVLMGHAESDSDAQANVAAFRETLHKLGWVEGRNIWIDTRWPVPADVESMQRLAKELVVLQPDTGYITREYVQAGGLLAYGPNFADIYRRAGNFFDKILRGTKPGDIPVEQPTKFDLIINLTTAKALRIEVPPTLLARAYRVFFSHGKALFSASMTNTDACSSKRCGFSARNFLIMSCA
jgi:hypothetical protein